MAIDIKIQLELLKKLQSVDLRIHDIDLRLQDIPNKLEESQSVYRASRELLTAKETEKNQIEHDKHTMEKDLEADIAHTKERELKLYAIKTNKEYQAALKEIADGKKHNKDREDILIQKMEKIESLTQEIAQLSTETADKEAVYKKAEEELKAEEAAIRQEREKDVAESAILAKDIDKEVIRIYQFIRARYPDTLVQAKNGVCTGCNMNIPPQLFLELRKLLKFSQCPSCKRILYFQDDSAAEAVTKTAENKITS